MSDIKNMNQINENGKTHGCRLPNIKNKKPRDENGKPNGEWVIYHDNDQLDFRINCVHGVAHGLAIVYTGTGKVGYSGHYNMGRRVGYWYYIFLPQKYYLCLI